MSSPFYTDRKVQPVKHGLYARSANGKQRRDHRVRRLAHKVGEACPWITDSDLPAVRAWSEFEILAGELYWALKTAGAINFQRGAVDGDLHTRRLLNDFRVLRQTQLTFARELGLTPAARLQISGRGAAPFDLAGEMARAQPIEDAEVVGVPALANGKGTAS